MDSSAFIPYNNYTEYPREEMIRRAREFREEMQKRRTVREFSDRDIPEEVINDCIKAAGTAPNGANLQPWHFSVVRSPELKRKIRIAAEKEEKEFYESRAPEEWLQALRPLGTDQFKPFLE
ncbi:MAG: nitroreductase family protein, partial [Balneolaceae bacterium]|nr:nitroreductase family protein [Balneolaceae bacterium]